MNKLFIVGSKTHFNRNAGKAKCTFAVSYQYKIVYLNILTLTPLPLNVPGSSVFGCF